jgi:hypothetical protein
MSVPRALIREPELIAEVSKSRMDMDPVGK